MPGLNDLYRCLIAFGLSYGIGSSGFKKKSLSHDGMWAAVVVGTITFSCGLHFGMTLIAFFLSSSSLTKLQEGHKKKVDGAHKEGGQRDAPQVMSNSFPSIVCALWYARFYGAQIHPLAFGVDKWATLLQCAFIGHYACVTGDTWASEIGVLQQGKPRSVLNCKPVPTGTNGGISVSGTIASILGGAFVATVYFLSMYLELAEGDEAVQDPVMLFVRMVIFGALAGFAGSMIDSFLGATLQFSGQSKTTGQIVEKPSLDAVKIGFGFNVMSNNEVNFASATITCVLCAITSRFFFP